MSKYVGLQIHNLVARVGRNDGVKTTKDGDKHVNFRLAFTKAIPKKDKPGEFDRKTTWISSTAWNALAERVVDKALKGVEVLVDGEVTSRSESDRGENRERHQLRISSLSVIGVPKEEVPEAEQDAPVAD